MNAPAAVMTALCERRVPYYSRTRGREFTASFDAKFGAAWAKMLVRVSLEELAIVATIDVPPTADVTRTEELVQLVNAETANGKFEYRPERGHLAFETVVLLGQDGLTPAMVIEAIGRTGRSFVCWRPIFLDAFHGGADFAPAAMRVSQVCELEVEGDDRAFRALLERISDLVDSVVEGGQQ